MLQYELPSAAAPASSSAHSAAHAALRVLSSTSSSSRPISPPLASPSWSPSSFPGVGCGALAASSGSHVPLQPPGHTSAPPCGLLWLQKATVGWQASSRLRNSSQPHAPPMGTYDEPEPEGVVLLLAAESFWGNAAPATAVIPGSAATSLSPLPSPLLPRSGGATQVPGHPPAHMNPAGCDSVKSHASPGAHTIAPSSHASRWPQAPPSRTYSAQRRTRPPSQLCTSWQKNASRPVTSPLLAAGARIAAQSASVSHGWLPADAKCSRTRETSAACTCAWCGVSASSLSTSCLPTARGAPAATAAGP
mmetsp:Transcript_11770/g.49583  ORF Transcript_11770/g.49583 Transcript_11770/m.49583 type:complete len:306 (-) Transcript_11770:383-1300(-)